MDKSEEQEMKKVGPIIKNMFDKLIKQNVMRDKPKINRDKLRDKINRDKLKDKVNGDKLKYEINRDKLKDKIIRFLDTF